MKRVDLRMNCLTEILNNIKVIKLNSYTDLFKNKFDETRKDEIRAYIWNCLVNLLNWTIMILFVPLIILISFSLYIGHGFTMTIPEAFATVYTLNLLWGPIRWVPEFMGEFM